MFNVDGKKRKKNKQTYLYRSEKVKVFKDMTNETIDKCVVIMCIDYRPMYICQN